MPSRRCISCQGNGIKLTDDTDTTKMISKKVTSKTKGDKSKTKRSRSVAARTSGLNSSFDPDAEPEVGQLSDCRSQLD